jgi:hypothetical protein
VKGRRRPDLLERPWCSVFRSAHFGAADNPGGDLVKAETKEVELVRLYSSLPGPDSMRKLRNKATATLRSCELLACRQHQVRLDPHQAHALAIAYRQGDEGAGGIVRHPSPNRDGGPAAAWCRATSYRLVC